MTTGRYALSVVIPVFNEEKRIRATVEKIIAYFEQKNVALEIIIVDDGSRDNSLEVIRAACADHHLAVHFLHNVRNMGKGFSVKRGMMFARGDIIMFTDADLSVPIEEYEKLEKGILEENYDVVFGSRGMKESVKIVAQGLIRDRMGKLFGMIVRQVLLPDVRDSQCGFKAFKREAAHTVFYWQTIHKFGFDPEIIYIAKKNNFRCKEVPVSWKNDFDSKLNTVTDSFFMGMELVKIKIKSLLGHYTL